MWPIMFSVFRAESKNLYNKESLSCLCSLFVCFEVFFSFLKFFVYFFSLRTAYLASFVYTLYIEKKIYHSFLFVNTNVSQATFPVSFVHWSTRFSNFAAFFVLISCKKSRKLLSHICDPSKLGQSSFRTKKTVWKVFRKKNEMFSKKKF